MSEHTQEPWKLFESRDARPHHIYVGSHIICELHHTGYLDQTIGKLQLANANRIVKCVNALNGIDNPTVWRAQMGYMDSDHTLSLDIIQMLRKQHDSMLNGLKEIYADMHKYKDVARSALAVFKLIAEIEQST